MAALKANAGQQRFLELVLDNKDKAELPEQAREEAETLMMLESQMNVYQRPEDNELLNRSIAGQTTRSRAF